MSDFVCNLWACHGANVVDLLKGTGMESNAKDLGFGLYVVRGVVEPENCQDWHAALMHSTNIKASQPGTRAVELKGDGTSSWYTTLQSVCKSCTCRYDYAGTGKNIIFAAEDTAPFPQVLDWVHDTHSVDRTKQFDQIVANV